MEKKKSIFKKIILGVSACLIALCAIIPFIPKNKVDVVSANEVDVNYSFHASDFYTITCYYRNDVKDEFYTMLFSCDFKQVDNGIEFNPEVYDCGLNGLNLTLIQDDVYHVYQNGSDFKNPNYIFNDKFTLSTPGIYRFFPTSRVENITQHQNYFNCSLKFDEGFNCNVYKVNLSLSDVGYRTSDTSFKYLHFEYYDVNDLMLGFEFYVPSNFIFDSRTYYFFNPKDLTDDQVYNQGYSDGYTIGKSDGSSSGYMDGYNAGLVEGFNNGYDTGVNDSNQYSFYNLFGAVLDAPVRVFSDLFNFNLLGINLLGLITGLFTLAMIILIIKLILGGK